VETKKDRRVRIHCKDFRVLQFTMPFNLADTFNTKKQMVALSPLCSLLSALCSLFSLLCYKRPFLLQIHTMRKVVSTLRLFAFSGRLKNLFAFSHALFTKHHGDGLLPSSLPFTLSDFMRQGWERANVRKDLQRMGLPSLKWRISEANSSYAVCPTYPSVFAIPASVPDVTLLKVILLLLLLLLLCCWCD